MGENCGYYAGLPGPTFQPDGNAFFASLGHQADKSQPQPPPSYRPYQESYARYHCLSTDDLER